MENLKEALSCYIPRPVILSLATTNSKWVAELRVASVLFVRMIGLKFNIDNESVISLGTNVEALQDAIYRYHGTLCRIIVDDKGCGALVGYGLPPFSHEDMQARAVRAALGIVRSLKKLKTKCSVVSCTYLSPSAFICLLLLVSISVVSWHSLQHITSLLLFTATETFDTRVSLLGDSLWELSEETNAASIHYMVRA